VDLIPIGPDDGWGDKTITITSLYDGVDYRETNGAALIVYRNTTNKNSLSLQCPTVWKNVILRANHAVANCVTANNWHLDCNRLTTKFESTFTTEAYIGSTKLNHRDASVNPWYFPLLCGDSRYQSQTGNTNITVNGGAWQYICAGTAGFKRYESDQHGMLTGDTFVSFGAQAYTIEGIGGTSYNTGGRITGNATIKITGGAICGNVDLGGIGGFADEDSTATLIITGGNFDKVTAINDVSGAAGWYAPKSATIDCSGLVTELNGKSPMERAEQIFSLITYVDSITMPDGTVRTFKNENSPLPEAVIERLRSTPYTRAQYKEAYDAIMDGNKSYNVINLLAMLSAKPTNAVEGFDVPANTDVMRERTIEYFDRMSQVEWIPAADLDYTAETAYTTALIYKAGTTYVGMPYSSIRKPSASIIEFLPYLDANKTYTGPAGYKYLIGVDCGAPRLAWAYGGALCNSGIHAKDFQMMVNYGSNTKNVIDIVGTYDTSKLTDVTKQSTYNNVCAVNGADVMYEAYAQVRPCDYVGSRFFIGSKTTTDQHIRLAVEDAVVFRNGNGVISGSKSYLTLSEQTSTIHTVDGKQTTWLLNQKHTFNSLYLNGYIPMTTKTLKSGVVEAPNITFSRGSYAEGIDLVGRGTVESNYTIFAINATVKNASGKVVKEAVVYPYSLSHNLTSTVLTTPSGGNADITRDQGMSTFNAAVRSLPSGTYTYTATVTIGFGTKTITEFTFTK